MYFPNHRLFLSAANIIAISKNPYSSFIYIFLADWSRTVSGWITLQACHLILFMGTYQSISDVVAWSCVAQGVATFINAFLTWEEDQSVFSRKNAALIDRVIYRPRPEWICVTVCCFVVQISLGRDTVCQQRAYSTALL